MTRSRFVILVLVSSVVCAQEDADVPIPDYTELKYAKPDILPLTVDVSRECPVGAQELRESAKRAIEDAGIEPVEWPVIKGDRPWFGIYVGLSCKGEESAELHVSFIDSIDGSFELFGGIYDHPEARESSDDHHIAAAGLVSPLTFPEPYFLSYSSFVDRVAHERVSKFLEKRFSL